jgi:hypothetical protein
VVPTICLASAIAFLIAAGSEAQDKAEQPSDPLFEYSRDPDTVVILFDLRGGLREDVPVLRIYGDGRVLVHRDIKQDFEMHLSDEEIQIWLRFLYDQGVLTFDAAIIRRSTAEIQRTQNLQRQSRGEPIASSTLVDVGPTIVEVRLKAFKAPEIDAEQINDFSHAAIWIQPATSAKEFPEIPELARLAEAVDALRELTKHTSLAPAG